MVSGSLPIEFGRAQGCFFVSGKMAISGSGSSAIEFGRAQGCYFFWKNGNLGFWKQISGFWKPSDRIRTCSRLFFFLENGNLGFWKPMLGFWK